MERKGYQLFSSMLKSVSIAMKMKKGTRSVVTTTRLVICASLSCVYFCNCSSLATDWFDSFTFPPLHWVPHYFFIVFVFMPKTYSFDFPSTSAVFFSFIQRISFRICSVKLFSIMPVRLICCVMSQIFEKVHDWKCLYLKEIWGLKTSQLLVFSASPHVSLTLVSGFAAKMDVFPANAQLWV